MKSRFARWTAAVLASVGLILAAYWFTWNRGAAEFEAQLRLARKEGLPTTAAEFASAITPAKPEENAAPIYKKLKLRYDSSKENPSNLADRITYAGDPAALAAAHLLLNKYGHDLAEVERAGKLPRCWFDRDWTLGYAVLFPEFSEMRTVGNLFLLRGTIAVHEGRFDDALADVRRCYPLARHIQEDPVMIGRLVGEAILNNAIRRLAAWSFRYRNRLEFLTEMRRAIGRHVRPNPREEVRGELYSLLSAIEMTRTPKGREAFGLKPDDIPASETFAPYFVSQNHARAALVKTMRDYWAALDLPQSERRKRIEAALGARDNALLAFPIVGNTFSALSGGPDPSLDREFRWEASRLMHLALHRALSAPSIPKTLSLPDLKSPFDGNPLRYAFDGKQIVIEVPGSNASGNEQRLWLPPNSYLKKGSP